MEKINANPTSFFILKIYIIDLLHWCTRPRGPWSMRDSVVHLSCLGLHIKSRPIISIVSIHASMKRGKLGFTWRPVGLSRVKGRWVTQGNTWKVGVWGVSGDERAEEAWDTEAGMDNVELPHSLRVNLPQAHLWPRRTGLRLGHHNTPKGTANFFFFIGLFSPFQILIWLLYIFRLQHRLIY